MGETTKTQYVPVAGGIGAGIGSTLPHAFQTDGVVALLAAAASGALIGGVLGYVLASTNE